MSPFVWLDYDQSRGVLSLRIRDEVSRFSLVIMRGFVVETENYKLFKSLVLFELTLPGNVDVWFGKKKVNATAQ